MGRCNATPVNFSPAEPEESLKQRREQNERRQAKIKEPLDQRPNATATKYPAETPLDDINNSLYNSASLSPADSNRQSMATASPSSVMRTTKGRDDTDPEDLFQTWMVCLADAVKNFTFGRN
jgi:hypothetical protein